MQLLRYVFINSATDFHNSHFKVSGTAVLTDQLEIAGHLPVPALTALTLNSSGATTTLTKKC